jgi:hypothetical protein
MTTTAAHHPDASQDALVNRVFQLTEAVGYAAGLADWPKAAQLMAERSPLLMSLRAEQSPAALATIRRIQAIDQAVRDDATAARTGLETGYREAMNRTASASQYHRVALL